MLGPGPRTRSRAAARNNQERSLPEMSIDNCGQWSRERVMDHRCAYTEPQEPAYRLASAWCSAYQRKVASSPCDRL